MPSTYWSFPEIGGEMFLPRQTVKSEAMSVYRKLGASSRSRAVGRSRELAQLDKVQASTHFIPLGSCHAGPAW